MYILYVSTSLTFQQNLKYQPDQKKTLLYENLIMMAPSFHRPESDFSVWNVKTILKDKLSQKRASRFVHPVLCSMCSFRSVVIRAQADEAEPHVFSVIQKQDSRKNSTAILMLEKCWLV